jgi:hypothetical protein
MIAITLIAMIAMIAMIVLDTFPLRLALRGSIPLVFRNHVAIYKRADSPQNIGIPTIKNIPCRLRKVVIQRGSNLNMMSI